MLHRIIFLLVIAALPSVFAKRCEGQGWSDYSITLPNGYQFVRCNNVETVICPPGSSSIIFSPCDFPNVGPVQEYATAPSFISLKTLGRKRRSESPADTYEVIDDTAEFYFLIYTIDHSITGPLSISQFQKHADVKSAGPLNWTRPRNSSATMMLGILALASLLAVGVVAWLFLRKVVR
jgi:hypothetical protein